MNSWMHGPAATLEAGRGILVSTGIKEIQKAVSIKCIIYAQFSQNVVSRVLCPKYLNMK